MALILNRFLRVVLRWSRVISASLAFTFVVVFSVIGIQWQNSFAVFWNASFTVSFLLFTALFLLLFPTILFMIIQALQNLHDANEIAEELVYPSDFQRVQTQLRTAFGRGGTYLYAIPLLFALLFLVYRHGWFMPRFLADPTRYTQIGHPPTLLFQIGVTVMWTVIYALIGALIAIAIIVYRTFRLLLGLDYNATSFQSIAGYFRRHGAITSRLAFAVMTTILLVPNFVLGQFYPVEFWVIILGGYLLINGFIIALPTYTIYLFLDSLKQVKLARLKAAERRLLQVFEAQLLRDDASATKEITSYAPLVQQLQAFQLVITSEEAISALPLTRSIVLTLIESIGIPLGLLLIGRYLEFFF